jgi:hypothetical protein
MRVSALQIIFLFFLQGNDLRRALIPFIGVREEVAMSHAKSLNDLHCLEAIIQVEQEVLARIAAEQKKSELWIQEQKGVLAQKAAVQRRDVCTKEELAEDGLRKDGEEKAAAYLRQAEERLLFLEKIDDAVLKDLIQKTLLTSLTGFEP